MSDSLMKWLLVLGIVANVLGKVGEDIRGWADWSNTFAPSSVGGLLVIVSAALVSFVSGAMAQRNVVPPEVQRELDRLRLLEGPRFQSPTSTTTNVQ